MEWMPEVVDLVVRALQIAAAGLLAYGAYVALVASELMQRRDPMNSGRPNLVVMPGRARDRRAAWRRAIVMTIAAAALLSAGVILGEMMSSHARPPEAAKTAAPAAQPPVESWYFPAQYVNQGKENEEQPWEY